jgi:cation diffusion facilitator CzcD-associated flavoprotein CzcO
MKTPVVIIGAGAAGLATARELARHRVPFRLLERGTAAGQTWRDLYDSLRLHTGRHLSALPGLRMPRGTPLFPTRLHYFEYLQQYARRFDIPVETGRAVDQIRRSATLWHVTAGTERIEARAVVVATGIVANPFIPVFRNRPAFEAAGGLVLHAAEYRRPAPFHGRRVLVIGVGNSGGEISSELARAGIDVSIAVRSGANVVPLTLGGVPIQYLSTVVRKLPRPAQERVVAAVRRLSEMRRGPPVLPPAAASPLDAIPLIGFHLVDEIRAGRVRIEPGVEAFTDRGVRFFDGSIEEYDVVILATGFRPALGMLGDAVQRDVKGFPSRVDRVTSADQPDLFFVGHNYDSRGGLLNIAIDAPAVAARLQAR